MAADSPATHECGVGMSLPPDGGRGAVAAFVAARGVYIRGVEPALEPPAVAGTPAPAVPGAFLDVRLLPWRPRLRHIDPEAVRSNADLTAWSDDLAGFALSVVLSVVIFVAAPLVAVVLAVLFLPVEVWLVVTLGVLVVVARFAGVIPWAVVTPDGVERYRFLPAALRRVRELDPARRVRVRWHWA